MNRDDLIKKIADKLDITQVHTLQIYEELIALTINELKQGREVWFTGLGKFETARRKRRKGINPQTQEVIDIPAKTVVKFKPTKALRDAVNK